MYSTINSNEKTFQALQLTLNRPSYLPANLTLQEYRNNPVINLGAPNYKVDTYAGPTSASMDPVLAVLDTGCGPNLVARELLSDEVLRKLKRDRVWQHKHGCTCCT